MDRSRDVVLRARGLTVSAGRHRLVGPVDLEVRAGERVALAGRSGSGKSLTVRALVDALPAGLRRDGDLDVVRRVGWVQQDTAVALHPLVTLGRQLERPLRRRGLGRDAARGRVHDVLARTGLDDRHAAARPGELSGGERQRGCLALALLGEPDLVVADEPTTALDTVAQRQVLDVLVGLDAALLLVTHDPDVAALACTRGLRVEDGVVRDAVLAPTAAPGTAS
ncbi:ABC transporter ATP-binding protein [Nocardioides lentus]|uniref:ABC transporter ATP-binding protein n=1 Tax=Nocardioides lentus TaxID=338077 RepID=A0ABP5B1G0_9ACTN